MARKCLLLGMNHSLEKYIPYIEPAFLEEIERFGLYKTFPPHTVILREGASVQVVPLVLNGLIKASSTSEEKDLHLYYIQPGETCIMSFSSCRTSSPSKILAVTEEETEVLLIPAEKLNLWLKKYPSLNRFFFDWYNQRYLDLLDTIDQLVFQNLETRLLKYLHLHAKAHQAAIIQRTHQQIANDLGTAREVISRTLKKLEASGNIEISRNEIKIIQM